MVKLVFRWGFDRFPFSVHRKKKPKRAGTTSMSVGFYFSIRQVQNLRLSGE
jgi:hypothetical protein